jgi:hypothetical protein
MVGREQGAQPSLTPALELSSLSAHFHRKDKELAGINTIWDFGLGPGLLVNDSVSYARAVGNAADAPEAVTTGYDRGRDLGIDPGGRLPPPFPEH